MVPHHWQNYIRMYIFFEKTCFLKTMLLYVTFIKCINQFPLLNAFSFLFPQFSFLIKFIVIQLQPINVVITHQLHHYLSTWFPSLLSLESSDSLHIVSIFYLFFVVSWMLQMLITLYKAKFTLWRTLVTFMT